MCRNFNSTARAILKVERAYLVGEGGDYRCTDDLYRLKWLVDSMDWRGHYRHLNIFLLVKTPQGVPRTSAATGRLMEH